MIAEKDRANVQPQETPSSGRPVRTPEPSPELDRFRPRAQNWSTARRTEPMAKRRTKGVHRAKEWGQRRPETFAVLIGSFLVSLLCFYVAAYARVTAESFERARLSRQLDEAEAEQRALQTEVSRLRTPETVRVRAQALGLVERDAPTLNLVTPTTPYPAATPAVSPTDSPSGDRKEVR